jgi:hypothetical protein
LIPAAAPAQGKPQLAAWNIGTTGSITLRASKSKHRGCRPVIAWQHGRAVLESTPLGLPVVPLV